MKNRSVSVKKLFGGLVLVMVILFFLSINSQSLLNSIVNDFNEQIIEGSATSDSSDLNIQEVEQIMQAETASSKADHSGPVSYSFAGKKTLSEIQSIGFQQKPDPDKGNENGQTDAGDNEIVYGAIPDLTIKLNGMDLENVAQKLGFQLVASTEERILGKIKSGDLTAMNSRERKQYADRARDADSIDNYDQMIRNISSHTGIPKDEIRLFYLVPKNVEQGFIQFQKQEMEKAGLTSDNIHLMIARYQSNLDLELISIIRK